MASELPSMYKAYDIRGIYPDQINAETAYAIGQAYTRLIVPKTVAVGHDVRTSGPELYDALIRGLTDAGVNVVKLGGISTEMLYFVVAHYGYDGGISVTASHNPKEYNGMKMVRAGAEPITGETGVMQIRDMVPGLIAEPVKAATPGTVTELDFFDDFRTFVLSFIDTKNLKPVKLVANANFGFQGQFAKRLFEGLPVELVLLNGEPDGTFPKGRPDPFIPENRPEFLELIKSEGADLGVAWDADADRCFFATGSGIFLESYFTNGILAKAILEKHPGASILYDVRYTWASIDAISEAGGKPIEVRCGHSYIKTAMREHDAIFCGEASGHLYFRDYFYADTGFVPLLLMLELLAVKNTTIDELVKPYLEKYFVSGEINRKVANADAIIAALKEKYADATTVNELDRLTIEYGRDWRFNVRTSNTEPLLRLNLEANSQALMETKRDEVLGFIDSTANAA